MSEKPLEYFPIEIVLGSENDIKTLEELEFFKFCRDFKVPYTVSVISAHRNPEVVPQYCREQSSRAGQKPLVFIALAGKRNDLAPAIAACIAGHRQVVAAVIPNAKDPSESRDIFLAMPNIPQGTAVAWTGYDAHALKNAFIHAAQGVCQGEPQFNPAVRGNLKKLADSKPAQLQHIVYKPEEQGSSS